MTKQEAEKLARVWVALCEFLPPERVRESLFTQGQNVFVYEDARRSQIHTAADIIAQEFEGEEYRD